MHVVNAGAIAKNKHRKTERVVCLTKNKHPQSFCGMNLPSAFVTHLLWAKSQSDEK